MHITITQAKHIDKYGNVLYLLLSAVLWRNKDYRTQNNLWGCIGDGFMAHSESI